MRYTELGGTGIRVSKICVGGMSFGKPSGDFHQWTLEQAETTAMIAHAFELGVNFIDTANGYSHGTSEEYIGRALRELGIPRDAAVIASKVYYNEGRLSRAAVQREIEGTLRRLGTDYLDLYYIHRFDYGTPIEETLEALDALVQAGKVRAIGASAMYGYQFQNMQIAAERNGWTKFSVMQNHYNLMYREDERELIPVCRQCGVSLVPYSPLAGGHLTHPGWTTSSRRSRTDRMIREKYDHSRENDLEIIGRTAETAAKHGVPMAVVALSWLFRRGVASAIVGATSVPHFDDAVRAVDFLLPDEDARFLEEAYAPHAVVGALAEEK